MFNTVTVFFFLSQTIASILRANFIHLELETQ